MGTRRPNCLPLKSHCVVLLWDLLVAVFIRHRVVLQYFLKIFPNLERISGVILIGLAMSVIAANILRLT